MNKKSTYITFFTGVLKRNTLFFVTFGVVSTLGVAYMIAIYHPQPLPSPKKEQILMTTQLISQVPSMEIDIKKKYSAMFKTTQGSITVDLFADKTPITANNFISLSRKHFYDGTKFHRVIKGFMIQGGDPKGDGTGGPGYQFDDEPFTGEYTRGIIAMANAGPNTNGSQFFIMHEDYALPKNYIIFGRVSGGMDIVDAIASSQVMQGVHGEYSKPVQPTVVTSVEIQEQ